MTTLQIVLEESVAEEIRKKAEIAGKSPEAWVAEIATQQASPANKDWISKFVEAARNSGGDSKGWKWNRDEIHER